MMRRLVAALAVAMLGAGLAAGPATAGPIEPLAVYDCPSPQESNPGQAVYANICLYDWINYQTAGGFFRRTFTQISAQPGDCINLGSYYWHDYDGTVGDHASSLIINHANLYDPYTGGQGVEFYEWTGCQESGRSFQISYGVLGSAELIPNLSNINNTQATIASNEGTNFYDTIQSIRVGGPTPN